MVAVPRAAAGREARTRVQRIGPHAIVGFKSFLEGGRAMDRKYFVLRQNYEESECRAALFQEIRSGRFRQGWGCSGLDLTRSLGDWITAYLATWNESAEIAQQRYWILNPMLEIKSGDLIVVPKQPRDDKFLILKALEAPDVGATSPARAESAYSFENLPAEARGIFGDDFRHIIHVDRDSIKEWPSGACTETLLLKRKFNGYQKAVNNVADRDVRAAVDRLLDIALVEDLPTIEDIIRNEAVLPVYKQVLEKLRAFPPSKLEEIVEGLFLRAKFEVQRRQWYDRCGGDVDRVFTLELAIPPLLDLIGGIAITLQLNVQVKQKTGIDQGDICGVEQLLKMRTNAANEYSILISTADSFTDGCRKLAAENGVILIDGIKFAEIILKYVYV
jgi:hypothetical protein